MSLGASLVGMWTSKNVVSLVNDEKPDPASLLKKRLSKMSSSHGDGKGQPDEKITFVSLTQDRPDLVFHLGELRF
jgi:hypothetical protein